MRVGLDLGGVIVRSAQGVSVRDTPGPATAWREVCGAAPPGFATHVVSWTEIVTALGACE